MLQSFFYGLFWVLFAYGTLNRGTETPLTELGVSETTEKWDRTDAKPFEHSGNKILDQTHTNTDPQTHHIAEQSVEDPFPSNLCQDDLLEDETYTPPGPPVPLVKRCHRDSQGKMGCNRSHSETGCNHSNLCSCFVYPTKRLNCSCTLNGFPEDSQYSSSVIVCDKNKNISTVDCASEVVGDKVGGIQGHIIGCHGTVDNSADSVIHQMKVSVNNILCLYSQKYNFRNIEILSPPPNITVERVEEAHLLVQWGIPVISWTSEIPCFEYELVINDQKLEIISGSLSHKELNPDPTLTYNVKIRTRTNSGCHEIPLWSDWSEIFEVPPSISTPPINLRMIIGLSLGIPVVLLALLLLLRPLRVSERLFPPIPHPPIKIRRLLEEDDHFVPPNLSKCMEEISIVEEAKETPEK